jgi:uncharacterized protein (DUF1015 family)
VVTLAPFRALRYDPQVAGPSRETSAPPYDDLDPLRYAAHRTTNPYTVLELLTGEAASGPRAHDAARAALDRWERTGVLVRDPSSALYLYEQHELRFGQPVVQRGIVGTLDLADLETGSLLPHEHVDDERVARRVDRLLRVPLDLTPVVAVHSGPDGDALRAVAGGTSLQRGNRPVVAFTDEAAVDHRLWRIDDPRTVAEVVAAAEGVRAVLADGHHRVAAARQLHRHHAAQAGERPSWRRITAWLVDAADGGPELRPVHRLVVGGVPRDDAGVPAVSGFRMLPWRGGPLDLERATADAPGLAYGLVTADGAWLCRARDPEGLRSATARLVGAPLAALDAQVLASVVLPAIGDPPVEAISDATAGARRVAEGAGALVLLRPPTIGQVMRVAASGQRMPPKTTWFRPKPRAGLVMRRLDVDGGGAGDRVLG